LILGVFAAVVPLAAYAQNNGGANPSPNPSATTTASATDAPTASETANARPATGYGYSDKSPRRAPGFAVHSGTGHPRRTVPHAAGPIATLPGFEMLPEGGSRLFVEVTQPVRIEEHKSRGKVTYVLKGAHVALRNNENPLVTVHFNTPVTQARLFPVGNDLHFVVDLRADATPTWKGAPGKEGSFVLTIDFPKGTYIPHATQ
jgi:hypothetical protein